MLRIALEYRIKVVETNKQGIDQMTYAETKEMMGAIEQLKTFSAAIERQKQKEGWDWAEIDKLEKYLEEAAQTIFTLCSK